MPFVEEAKQGGQPARKDIPSFIYTSAHVRDLEMIQAMVADIATFEWKGVDPRCPKA